MSHITPYNVIRHVIQITHVPQYQQMSDVTQYNEA